MDAASQSWASIFGWGSAFVLVAFGIGLMLSNPTNIERPVLVGAFTAAGGLIVGYMIWRTQNVGGPFSWSQVFAYTMVGVAVFAWGRLIDYLLGGTPVNREADEETMGAHLSD